MNKLIVIYHSRDLDGWASAAIIEKRFNEHVTLEFIGWDYGQGIPSELYGSDKYDIFIADVSFPKIVMEELYDRCNWFTWCDHHISSIKKAEGSTYEKCDGLRDTNFAACELTWKCCYPDDDMPRAIELLGLYDSFRHKTMSKETQNDVMYFQWMARAMITEGNFPTFLLDIESDKYLVNEWICHGRFIDMFLKTDAKRIYDTAKINFEMDGFKFCGFNKERFNPINFDINYHADGYDGSLCFWFVNGKWTFSLYNDNDKVDCSVICKKRGGGGHAGAAGFIIDSIEDFLNYIC